MPADHAQLKPRLAVRRFDVFAEYNRLRALKKGLDDAHARGYGLWVAKVVASGGGRRGVAEPKGARPEGEAAHHAEGAAPPEPQEWHTLGDEPQTDALFDKEVVRRMGDDFYNEVFAPAIQQAFDEGKSYESIRDTIRKEWKP
ncbi:MAG: hypothetical protein U0822_10880 [Anaerolineae bacterium]